MENEYALHKCVTEFMLDTCRYEKSDWFALLDCFARCDIKDLWKDTFDTFFAGSSAEFYIEPMLPFIGDIDTMACSNSCLAIPAGHTPPTELPAHFDRTVTVYEIIDSHQPGFIYLKPSYILGKTDHCHYEATPVLLATTVDRRIQSEFLYSPGLIRDDDNISLSSELRKSILHQSKMNRLMEHCIGPQMYSCDTQVHGPALHTNSTFMRDFFAQLPHCGISKELVACMCRYLPLLNLDSVHCTRCLLWPPQAADWPTRSRDHDWPNRLTIDMIVGNGCDVVAAVHPRCRQDEWMTRHQWRLSFSRAEITLLNSWTPVQQIIYHMLRYVLKRLSITSVNDQELPKLCNYHVKTLMLWECEQKPQSWWSAEFSLIRLCSSLLRQLSDWVEKKHCQHYFVSNCNLLDYLQAASLTFRYELMCLADSSVLLTWFVNNYIRECAQYCPENVLSLFEGICSTEKLQRAVDAVVIWKLTRLSEDLYLDHNHSEFTTLLRVEGHNANAAWIHVHMKELRKLDLCLCDYFIALMSLQVAFTVSIHSLTEELLEMLWTLFNPLTAAVSDMVASRLESGGILCIRKSLKLATLTDVRNTALEMLHNEMSKAYLHHSFAYGQESTYCVVHLLLAVLYCKSGHYQSAIDHCKQVPNQSDPERYGSRYIGAEYLPQIDENIDAVLGLILLYQYVQRNALNSGKSLQPDAIGLPAFTTEILAQYLCIKCLSVVTTKEIQVQTYRQHLSQSVHALVSDILLFKATERQLSECTETHVAVDESEDDGSNDSRSMDTTLLVETLELVALEKLITFRQATVLELGSWQFPVVNEFEALYAYKCGSFEECMELCRRDIGLLFGACSLTMQSYYVVFPTMLSLLDGELVSLFGIIRLLHPETFCLALPNCQIHISTLLLYLLVRCQVNLRSDSLHDSLKLICYAYNEVLPSDDFDCLDRPILRLTYRLLKLHIKKLTDLY